MRLPTIVSAISRLAAAGGFAALALGAYQGPHAFAAGAPEDLFVAIAPGQVEYYSTAEGLMNGRPVAPRRMTARFDQPVHIMKRQVSQAEYAECVRDKGCRPLDKSLRGAVAPDRPVVGVSWQDATDYAKWYSGRAGGSYRLPTYAEWLYAAGEAYKEEMRLDLYDSDNPAQRWLAEYALEAQRKVSEDAVPKPFGSFGVNAAGVQDLGGNVWEWTDTCHVREYLDEDGNSMLPPNENCGVRVVAGSHYSLITDFIRDPKGGACSVGIPPANLGIRLVRDTRP